MKRFVPKEFEGRNPKRNAGLFYAGPDRNYAILRMDATTRSDQPFEVLFHEFTHGILRLNFPSIPTWLDEGIADFYGATEIRKDRVLIGKVPLGRLETLRTGTLLPLETLLRVTQDSPHYREGDKSGQFYAQSWALVHYLFLDEQAQAAGLFKKYLAAFDRLQDPVVAGREGFGNLEALQGSLAAYVRRVNFKYWNYELTARGAEQELSSRSLDPAAALVVRGEFLQMAKQEREAEALLQAALRLNPDLPEVHAALGYGHYLRKEFAPAAATFERALRLGSTDFRPPYYLARLALEGHGGSSKDSPSILDYLKQAQLLRPDFPGIQMQLCLEYSRDPAQAELALAAGQRAIRLEPQNLAFRANFGIACMNLGLDAEASAVGDQLAKLAREPWEKSMADQYGVSLGSHLDRRKARADGVANSMAQSLGDPQAPSTHPRVSGRPLKFQLPGHLAALGQEVLKLVSEGKRPEAIRKVESALAAARTDYDRKALRKLLEQLHRDG
jgi:tetratricopeptide (TPR) repeat protein